MSDSTRDISNLASNTEDTVAPSLDPADTLPLSDPPTESGEFDGDFKIPGYVLTRLLGQGAYGQVWQGVRIGAGQDVAVKLFTAPGKLDWRYLQREVDRLLRVAEHPHIVTLLDANLQHRPPFYVMALLRRGSLSTLCKNGERIENTQQATEWFEQIVKALEFAHSKGLMHCDIKPANVLLDEESSVRLVDFGQAQLRGEAAHALGTITYMAPEQAVVARENESPPDPTVGWDIYGVGATMYALVTGQAPHSREDLQVTLTHIEGVSERLAEYRRHVMSTPITPVRRINPAIDADLAEIIEHCLKPLPHQRYQNAAELAMDLRNRKAGRPLKCHPAGDFYRFRKFVKRNLGMVVIILVAALAMATVSTTRLYLEEAQLNGLISRNQELETQLDRNKAQIERLRDRHTEDREHIRQLEERLRKLRSPASPSSD